MHRNDIIPNNFTTNIMISRPLRIFLAIVLSVLLWVAIKLLRDYNTQIQLPINYSNLPSQLKLTTQPPNHLTLNVEGPGHQLLFPSIGMNIDTLSIDIENALSKGFIQTNKILNNNSINLSKSIKINQISPDTIYLPFAKKITKKVPIINLATLALQKGHFSTEPMRLMPDSVTLVGTENDLKNIDSWKTSASAITQTNDTLINNLISLESSQSIATEPQKVQIIAKITPFTEQSIEQTIQIENLPADRQLRLLPNPVTIKYLVPLNLVESIKNTDLVLTIDYNHIKENPKYLIPNISCKSTHVQNIRLKPPYLRYTITTP